VIYLLSLIFLLVSGVFLSFSTIRLPILHFLQVIGSYGGTDECGEIGDTG